MQETIALLSDETINQIAAGEVIESPASVIKELVENALDAEAKRIVISFSAGGLKSLSVSDDGRGMNGDNARLCILRHATSKISSAADLFRITTKGFRGEALASIASISKMTIATNDGGEKGIALEVENGKIVSEKPCARKRGTTIEVRSLFYNVPARMKFQKAPAALAAQIYRIVTGLALSYPNVEFELVANGKVSLKTVATDLMGRANELLGENFTEGSLPLEFEEGPMRFEGLIGSPLNTRANRLGQHLFLNRRGVQCAEIEEAVRAGYATRLEERRYPLFLLYLDVPCDLVDVNVHPQKLHVRLRKEELFRGLMEQAVDRALSVKRSVSMGERKQSAFTPTHFSEEKISYRLEEEQSVNELPLATQDVEYMGQVGQYLFYSISRAEALSVINAVAAHSALIFEKLKDHQKGKKESQALLVPFTIFTTAVETAMVLTHQDAIENLGFRLRPIGKDAFMVEALPPFLSENEVEGLIRDMANKLQEFIGAKDITQKRAELLAKMAACRKSGKKHYDREEALLLYRRIGESSSQFSPQGDKITVQFNEEQLENLFKQN